MLSRLMLAAFCLSWGMCFGQEVKLPAEISVLPGQWAIVAPEIISGGKAKFRTDPGLQEVRLDILFPPELAAQARGRVYQSTEPGRYRVECWNAKDDVASDIAVCWVTIIGKPPVPVTKVQVPNVVGLKLDAATELLKSLGLLIQHQSGAATEPIAHQSPAVNSFAEPGSTVVVNTGPPLPPPVVAGPRTVLIVRESAKDSPSDARMYASLQSQSGIARQYLKSKGHSGFVLDVSEPLAEKWSASLNIPLPALAILDDKGAVLFKVSLAEGATADEVISILKSKGG